MLLRSNRELGQTTLMITHNPEAAAIASRILYMRDGELVREGKGSQSDIVLPATTAILPLVGPSSATTQFEPAAI